MKWSEVNNTHHGDTAHVFLDSPTPSIRTNSVILDITGTVVCPGLNDNPALLVGGVLHTFGWWYDVEIQ